MAMVAVAHHDGGRGDLIVPAAPALADVRALGLLAHRGELEPTQLAFDLHVLLPLGHDPLQPIRLAQVLLLLCLRSTRRRASVHFCQTLEARGLSRRAWRFE